MNFKIFIGIVLVVGCFVGGLKSLVDYLVSEETYYCEQRWSKSGLTAAQTQTTGCLVQLKDGNWYPEQNVKVDVK